MSNTTTDMAHRSRRSNLILTGVSVLLAALFIRSGLAALSGGAEVRQTFEDIGAGQWLRVVTGILEIGLAIGMLVPRMTGPAAVGLTAVMVGAVTAELFLVDGGNAVPAAVFMLLAAGIAWMRRDQIDALVHRSPGPTPARATTRKPGTR